ncbi:exodeoxyribonuclease V alpha chain [Wigglesworthia glossinidia endosymbiont of Glossina morsitans morsitans (Yale colony)]|uniref:Exodeoxyribonuclease V alpha chain n=1 Tax=Wigglesworthia glossinidia endosymbiont of Glossina morsitans morsitans (Yale colony) TaxID=1142511 RepID=H6Q548_WIGGL|nr:hypothetical protein [Wigglesworthia glossinidia]AFA41331.1 exodeoxyribonuclease V alpha chain [Wigglesworthia glossinidia endosymbiont of Glossina morsitans morsitans (Yale colony)]
MKIIKKIFLKLQKIEVLNSLDIQFSLSINIEKEPYLILASAFLSAENRLGNSYLSLYTLKKLFKKHELDILWEVHGKVNTIKQWENKLFQSKIVGHFFNYRPIVLFKQKLYLYNTWKNEVNFKKFLYTRFYFPCSNKKNKIIFNFFNKYITNKKNNFWKIQSILNICNYSPAWILGEKALNKKYFIFDILSIFLELNSTNYCHLILVTLNKRSLVFFNKQIRYLKKKYLKNNFSINCIVLYELLNSYYYNQDFVSYRYYPIYCDFMIIYDISMINLSVINDIINVYKKNTSKIVFIGNHSNFKNIEKGSILSQIYTYCKNSKKLFYKPKFTKILNENIFSIEKLNTPAIINNLGNILIIKNFKKHKICPNINYLAKLIKIKYSHEILSFINKNIYKGVKYVLLKNQLDCQDMINKIFLNYVKFFNKIKKNFHNINYILNYSVTKFRVICTSKYNYLGVYKLNYIIENMLKNYLFYKYNLSIKRNLYTGRLVISKIDYSLLDIYKNDIGIIIENYPKSYVYFYKNKKFKKFNCNMFVNLQPAFILYIKDFLDLSITLDNAIILLSHSISSNIAHEFLYTTLLQVRKKVIIYDFNNSLKRSFLHSAYKKVGIL